MDYRIVHRDVDGVISGALLKIDDRAAGIDAKYHFADYGSLPDIFSSLDIKGGDSIVIADLGYNKNMKKIFSERSYNPGCPILYIDHHDGWPSSDLHDALGVHGSLIVDKNKCTSEIIRDHLLPGNDIAAYLAQVARWDDMREGHDECVLEYAKKLRDVIASGYDCNRIIDVLSSAKSRADLWDGELEKAYDRYQPVKREALRMMGDTARTYALKDGGPRVTLVSAPREIGSKAAREYVKDNYTTDAIFVLRQRGLSFEILDIVHFQNVYRWLELVLEGIGGRGLVGGGFLMQDNNPDPYECMVDMLAEHKASVA